MSLDLFSSTDLRQRRNSSRENDVVYGAICFMRQCGYHVQRAGRDAHFIRQAGKRGRIITTRSLIRIAKQLHQQAKRNPT